MLSVHLDHVVFLHLLHKICRRMPWNVWNICPQILCHTAKAQCEWHQLVTVIHCENRRQSPSNVTIVHSTSPTGPSGDMSHTTCRSRKLVFEYCTIWWIITLLSGWLLWPHFRTSLHNIVMKITLRTCCFCCTCKVPKQTKKEQYKAIQCNTYYNFFADRELKTGGVTI